ncbi:hypothetical protein C8J57DRAFT_1504521 [Mycena rebaudengoi]|nr:hypothetical protein C8J57DRAFT_1504521 [Mycena rebaudengoi]
MRFSLAALALVVPSLVAVITMKNVSEKKEGSYIVTFKDGATYTYEPLFNRFATNLDTDALNALRADPDVKSLEEDAIMHTQAIVTQTDALP